MSLVHLARSARFAVFTDGSAHTFPVVLRLANVAHQTMVPANSLYL
jgi:hypothetical protein